MAIFLKRKPITYNRKAGEGAEETKSFGLIYIPLTPRVLKIAGGLIVLWGDIVEFRG